MTWLDNVFGIPILGVRIKTNFRAASDYPKIFSPLIQELEDENQLVAYQYESLKHFIIETESGRTYQFTPKNINVQYNYLLETIIDNKRVPTYKNLQIRPYSELLNEASEDLINALNLLSDNHKIFVDRVGVVASTYLILSSAPPGIKELLDNINSVWSKPLIKSNSSLTPTIEDNDDIQDRCHSG